MPRNYSAFLLIALTACDAAAAAPPPPAWRDLPVGTVTGGHLWVVYRRQKTFGAVEVAIRRLDGTGTAVNWWSTVGSRFDEPRWHLAHGALWLLSCDRASSIIPEPRLAFLDFRRLVAADALGNVSRDDESVEDTFRRLAVEYCFNNAPAQDYRLSGHFCKFDAFSHAAFVPTGPGSVRHFALTNVKSLGPTDRGGDTVVVGSRPPPEEDCRTPHWHFSAHAKSAKWNAKAKNWDDGGKGWAKEETLDVAFREPFRAFADGKDYYFLTDSGSLYRSPPAAAKGKPRPVARVYDGRERPVSGVITDADAGRTFLFLPPAKPGGKPAFFVLSEKPEPAEYDPVSVPAPKLDEPHRTIMHRAQILVALKKIESKPAADAKK